VVESPAALLTVLVPPSIVTAPQSSTNLAGGSAVFTVTAAGTTPLAYQWFFNSSTAITGATNSSLTLSNILTANAGTYQVRVTNTAGTVTSSAATLTVIEMDFGDAPSPTYPTTLASNGARHR